MIEIILFQPEIPQNTGNIGRICSFAGCRLHLIHPLGFEINDRNLKRAGMDYWKVLDVIEHQDWQSFISSELRPKRIHLLTTHAKESIWKANFKENDGLLFGNEGSGAPNYIHEWVSNRVCIPKQNDSMRSLNLAVSVGIACYELGKQINSNH